MTSCFLKGLGATLSMLLLPLGQPAWAETILLDEISVRAASQPQNEESLTIREVRESPARDMGEALQGVPGLDMVRKGAIANDVVLRGLQGDDINVFLDGVRLHGGCPSRMDPPSFHFDFAEVERIEIIKGPFDVENPGSLGGRIDAVSARPQPGLDGAFSLTYGSYDLVNASAKVAYGGETFDALAGYAYKYSLPPRSGDGKRITDIYPSTSANRYRSDDLDSRAYSIDTAWVKGGYKISDQARSELSYSYQDADHVLYPALLMDADYDRTHRVNWTTTVDNLAETLESLTFQLYWNEVEHLMNDSFRVSSLPGMAVTRDYSMQTDADTETFGAKLKGSRNLGAGQLDGGIDYYLRNWDANNVLAMTGYRTQPMIPDVDIDNLGLFVTYNLPLDQGWTVEAGLRADSNRADAGRLDATRWAAAFAPYYSGKSLDNDTNFTEVSGYLKGRWQVNDALELFAGFGSGSRTPDPQELYISLLRPGMNPNWIGNPDLSPTRNNQTDLGARLAGDAWFAKLNLFYSDLQNYINVVAIPARPGVKAARSYRNVAATIWGGELTGQVALPGDFYLAGQLSYTHGDNDDTDEPLAEMPPLKGSVSLRYDVDRWFVEVAERFADNQDRVDASLTETETAGWGVTDLKAGMNWGSWSVIGGINNLFDKYYFSHLSYQRDPFNSGYRVPETGSLAYVTVAYRF